MSHQKRSGNKLRSLFSFTKSERRGILWLLPLMAVVAVVIVYANRPSFEKNFLELTDKQAQAGSGNRVGYLNADSGVGENDTIAELFRFDPNTVTLQELCRLGFSTRTAAGIIKYRERGKRFEIPEDFATCYGVSLGDYTRLEPYITIGSEFRVKKGAYGSGRSSYPDREPMADDIVLDMFDPNGLDVEGFVALGFSHKQAEVIVGYRESMGGFGSADDLARCYVVSQKQMERLRPYVIIEQRQVEGEILVRDLFENPLELNVADSAALRSVSGIGGVLVERIIDYRKRLGGFALKEQLVEVAGMTEANYERICKQIWVDSCEIQKIDVNFATHKKLVERLGSHPYMTNKILRKLLGQRQLKGGWSTQGDIVKDNIMTQKEADRLAPYLVFVTK